MKKFFFVTSIISLCAGSSLPVMAMETDCFENESITPSFSPLQNQDEINKIVISTAKRVYEKINTNWSYVPPDSEMWTGSKMWEAKWIKGFALIDGERQETMAPTLVLKTSPDHLMEALEDLISKPASLECTIALSTAKIFCLREILGEVSFNQFVGEFCKMAAKIEDWNDEEFFFELPLQFLTRVEGKEAIPASITYITNIPAYPDFKPKGNGMGSNLFCIGPDQYLGFSAIYKEGPQHLDVIEKQDFELFTKRGDVEREPERHEKQCKIFEASWEIFVRTRRKYQEKVNFYQFFDIREIDQFIKTGEMIL